MTNGPEHPSIVRCAGTSVVCVPKSWDVQTVEAFANHEIPMRYGSGFSWRVQAHQEELGSDPVFICHECSWIDGHVHFTLEPALSSASSAQAPRDLELSLRSEILDDLFESVNDILCPNDGVQFETAMLTIEAAVAKARASVALIERARIASPELKTNSKPDKSAPSDLVASAEAMCREHSRRMQQAAVDALAAENGRAAAAAAAVDAQPAAAPHSTAEPKDVGDGLKVRMGSRARFPGWTIDFGIGVGLTSEQKDAAREDWRRATMIFLDALGRQDELIEFLASIAAAGGER